MKIQSPFNWIPESKQKTIFIVLIVVTLIIMVCLQLLGEPLETSAAPLGIVSFEFAGDLQTAHTIIDSWNSVSLVYAGLNLGIDYVFLLAYSFSIALGCVLVARSIRLRVEALSTLGIMLAWAVFAAALLDAVENFALINLLLGSNNEVWAITAYWAALPKFVIVALGLIYILLIGTITIIFLRIRKS